LRRGAARKDQDQQGGCNEQDCCDASIGSGISIVSHLLFSPHPRPGRFAANG